MNQRQRTVLFSFPTLAALLICVSTTPSSVAEDTVTSTYRANEVFRSDDGITSVESLGKGVFLFRWKPGLYVSPFLVGTDEVIVVDPISAEVAKLYRDAVAAVTDKPITKIIYSHEHLDHITGANVLSPDADRYAHPLTTNWLREYHADEVPLPTNSINDGDFVHAGARSIGAHYFGPNHGDGNIALSFDTDIGKLLVFVDTIEIGIAPYRSLPDTSFNGYLRALEGAAALDPDWVLGGHSGPGPGIWLTRFLNYFRDMAAALAMAEDEIGLLSVAQDESFIVASERHNRAIVSMAVDLLRPKYGDWYGFDEWAPMNADTVRMAIIVGK
ncbi:MAG: MBL fold metallo-hydrolase [Woeseiaceae bacterium]